MYYHLVISNGGEAIIYRGEYQHHEVAVRSVVSPDAGDWTSEMGQEIIKVFLLSVRPSPGILT